LWFRNTWSWGPIAEESREKPRISRLDDATLLAEHSTLGRFRLSVAPGPGGARPELLFTENDTNAEKLFGAPNTSPFVKDAVDRHVIQADRGAVNPSATGTKAAARFAFEVEARETVTLELRLHSEAEAPARPFGRGFDSLFAQRIREADEFYAGRLPETL